MRIFNVTKKHHYLIIFTILALIAVFYLWRDTDLFSTERVLDLGPRIRSQLACDTSQIGSEILNLRKNEDESVRIVIYFHENPTYEMRDILATKGITLYLTTLAFDNAVADVPVSQLCFIVGMSEILSIERAT